MQNFNDKLREAARKLASGEEMEIIIPHNLVASMLQGRKSADKPTAYIRNTMMRVNEVKEIGSLSVFKTECKDETSNFFGMDVYRVTLNREARKTVYSKKDVERIKAATASRTAEKILKLSPNLANYAPEEYATIAKVIAEIQAQIKENFLTEED